MKALTYIEIDLPYCSLTYGTAPCTAAIPTTGDKKCFNTLRTCQDRDNFAETTQTYRFALDTGYLPSDIEAIPSVVDVSLAPGEISLGSNLGLRSSLTVSFRDHKHSDTGAGFDKYRATRSYADPYAQGTFWGKFRARHLYVRGRNIRLYRGSLGQSLSDMEVRHYVIESISGPSPSGLFQLIAKDPLKFADDDRAVAPFASPGKLNANITAGATAATLSPAGIGNSDYPASGYLAIGGKEVVSFTRSGDSLTLTRGQYNTTAVAHNSESRVQLCLRYNAATVDDILYDLLVTYAGVPASFIALGNWTAEVDSYLNRNYSALITEPTGVRKLVSELIEQAGLAVWWDEVEQLIKLQVLRAISTSAYDVTEENTVADSLEISEQPEKRISEVWTYYAIRNPLEGDRDDNYRSILVTIDAQTSADYGSSAIKVIKSRWIPEFGASVAERVNDLQIARFRDPPRRFSFSLFRDGVSEPSLGQGMQLYSWAVQTDEGAAEAAPIQIVSLMPGQTQFRVEAEEMLFSGDTFDPNNRVVTIDTDTNGFDLEAVHDSLYPVITDGTGITLTCYVNEGVTVGSTSTGTPAFAVGSFHAALTITVINNGRIQGKGGNGGAGSPTTAGGNGGTALYTRRAITLQNNGEIWAGGGGGGGALVGGFIPSGGGGGAGKVPGSGGSGAPAGSAGTTEAGGAGGTGNNGGGPGLNGVAGTAAGGTKGIAIDGVSYCTITVAGDRRGTESS